MESFDFTFFVLPLGILVFVLVAGILCKVKKEEIEQERKGKRISAYLKERVKQRELVERELAHIDKLLKDKSIDKSTHERLKFVIRMNEMEAPEAIDA
jgi:predicted nucleotidyltransferase